MKIPSQKLAFGLFSLFVCAAGTVVGCSSSSNSNGDKASGGDGGGDQAGQSGSGGSSGGQGGSATGGKGGSAGGTNSGGSGGAIGGAGGATGGAGGATGGAGGATGGAGGAMGGAGGAAGAQANALCPAGAQYPSNPVPDGATPAKLKDGFEGTEGPVWVASVKSFFFSDLQRSSGGNKWQDDASSKIWKYDTIANTFEVFVAASGSNGLALTNDGKIIGALHSLGGLAIFDPVTKARTNYITGVGGKPLGSPNDLAVRADGNVYFSDPEWQIPMSPKRDGQGMKVYRADPQKAVSEVDATLGHPNGVTLSADGNTLYVTDDNKGVWKYKIAASGTTTKEGKFTTTDGGNADGMTADCAGNVYIATTGGVEIVSSAGAKVKTIGAVGAATNVAFGGADSKTLLITAGGDKAVYSIKLNIPGLPY